MTEAVTDIIVSRSRAHDSLSQMVVWSIGLHLAVLVGIFFAPGAKSLTPPVVMTITLSGTAGPKTEGMSEAASRTVQEVKPAETAKPVIAPPAPTRPEMTLPNPKAKTRPVVKPKDAPADASSRALSTGDQVKSGTAPAAPTQIRGQGFGLSTSGGNGTGATVDGGDFCCPDYLIQLRAAITGRWNQKQNVVGATNVIKFTISRTGTIGQIQLERGSGFAVLDLESQHAVAATAKLAPLPQAYPNSSLTVHLSFEYK
jgi:TonB family protein